MVNIGIDLHKTQFTICARNDGEDRFAQYPTTKEGYEAFLQEVAQWQRDGEEVRIAVESTGNARYFKNRMEEAQIEVTVINTLKMKVVTESTKKTDRYDAVTIAEFLEKDMLPKSRLCSWKSEQLRRLLKVRTTLVRAEVVMKNQIHALLTAEGMDDVKASLQSKRGRQRVLNTLKQWKNELVAQPLFETIDRLEENVKSIEAQIRTLVEGDRVVELLQTIPGCGAIGAWTIRAYTDDIKRFSRAKQYVAYAGLAPWVQNSNETVHHGRITKRGPKELRTALVQVVMGIRRMKVSTCSWRLMQRYEVLRKHKLPGVAIIATARKIAAIIWHMLTDEVAFDLDKMVDRKLAKKSEAMRAEKLASYALIKKQEKPTVPIKTKNVQKKLGVPVKREKFG